MMTIDQMELLFRMLIAQNKETKICVIFPFVDETANIGDCTIEKRTFGLIETIGINCNNYSVVKFRRDIGVEKEHSFVTWDNEANPMFEEYEQYLSHLLKFISFKDKV